MLEEQDYAMDDEAWKTFQEYLARRVGQPRFANARGVRNALERAPKPRPTAATPSPTPRPTTATTTPSPTETD